MAPDRTQNVHRLEPPLGVEHDKLEYKSAFDLPTSEGSTASERYLARLCQQSFLSLWAYPNTFTDEGMRSNRGSSGNEFADVLVVFGNDVVIFSDKHVKFHEDKSLDVAWQRWFKSAIARSVRQLHGAMSWAQRFPTRIYQDANCTRSLPVKMPIDGIARYHLVATTRGSADACIKFFQGGSGTLTVDSSLVGDEHASHPFALGRVNERKQFVHVIDEVALELVLRELDTAADFIRYLTARESFLNSAKRKVLAAGEEHLLAAYLANGHNDRHWFLPPDVDAESPSRIVFDESHWPSLASDPRYLAKKAADQVSYFWDALVDRFIKTAHPKYASAEATLEQQEHGLRLLASTTRFERRNLSEALLEIRRSAAGHPITMRARLYSSVQSPEIGYVFLIFPKLASSTYPEYRAERLACLQTYLMCARLKLKDASTFVGVAIDHPDKDYEGGSEDLGIFEFDETHDLEELRRIAKSAGILHEDSPLVRRRSSEYPEIDEQQYELPRDKTTSGKNVKRAKSKRKNARASRRANRKNR